VFSVMATGDKKSPFLKVREVAEFLLLSDDTVIQRIKDGIIEGTFEGGRWLVHRDEFVEYCQELGVNWED